MDKLSSHLHQLGFPCLSI